MVSRTYEYNCNNSLTVLGYIFCRYLYICYIAWPGWLLIKVVVYYFFHLFVVVCFFFFAVFASSRSSPDAACQPACTTLSYKSHMLLCCCPAVRCYSRLDKAVKKKKKAGVHYILVSIFLSTYKYIVSGVGVSARRPSDFKMMMRMNNCIYL